MGAGHRRRRRETFADEAGIDPSVYFDATPSAQVQRKVQQLCKEVERTLGYALPACADPRVRELLLVAVEPAPDASRLLVTLAPPGALDVDVGVLRERLQRLRGALRSELAAALQRKRTPELAFAIVPPPPPPAGDEPRTPSSEGER